MRFKEFLVEGMTDKEIREKLKEWREHFKESWYKNYSLGKVKIENGKLVHTSVELKILDFMVEDGKLALPFASAYKFDVWAKGLTSFENFPETLFFDYSRRQKTVLSFTSSGKHNGLTSLEHFPRKIYGSIDTSLVDNLNLTRCNKHIDRLEGSWAISPRYEGPILSTLLIPGMKRPYIATSWNTPSLKKLNDILEKHVKEQDIISAKEEMMAEGLKEYAKL